MTVSRKLCAAMLAAASLTAAGTAQSATLVGGFSFADNAFADTLIASTGTFSTSGGSLASVLTDIDAGTYANSLTFGASVRLGFTDNVLVNGAGNDLVLFDLGLNATFSVTIGATTRNYLTSDTGSTAGGLRLNAAAIDLSDFGLASGAELSDILIGMDLRSVGIPVPSLSLVGALNSRTPRGNAPEPASLLLLGAGLAGLALTRRRR